MFDVFVSLTVQPARPGSPELNEPLPLDVVVDLAGDDRTADDRPLDLGRVDVEVQAVQVQGRPGGHDQVVDIERVGCHRRGSVVHQLDISVIRKLQRVVGEVAREAGGGVSRSCDMTSNCCGELLVAGAVEHDRPQDVETGGVGGVARAGCR